MVRLLKKGTSIEATPLKETNLVLNVGQLEAEGHLFPDRDRLQVSGLPRPLLLRNLGQSVPFVRHGLFVELELRRHCTLKVEGVNSEKHD